MADLRCNFDFISSYCEGQFSIDKYQSKRTRMKLYHVKIPVPLVKLEICVQTRPYDDTGCAHTLEHLIFMGSRKYPRYGFLDHIASQFYSLGTNATTYRDMTTYELTTVQPKSILTLLPIYLDHVFNPLLTKECYLTEVHHISGETGEDGGVVYSEIQSSENQAQDIVLFSLMRHLWNENEPFYYESGGRLEPIRNELTLEKIKIFHKRFYRPENVAIVICGSAIETDSIISVLDKFEEENFGLNSTSIENQHKRLKLQLSESDVHPSIELNQSSSDFTTDETTNNQEKIKFDPTKLSVKTKKNENLADSSFCDSENFVSFGDRSSSSSPIRNSSLTEEIEENFSTNRPMNEYKEIFYPIENDEENLGQVVFGYRLDSIYNMESFTALDVLLTSLFDEDISIFSKEFLESPNVLCSSIDHDWFNYSERILMITFEGVELENLTLVADKFTSVLYSILNCSENDENFFEQITTNIKKQIEYHFSEIEKEPLDYLSDLCCLEHISELSKISKKNDEFDEENFQKFFLHKKYLEKLFDRSISFWKDLIKKYLIDWENSRRTIILLKPSYDLLVEQEENEEKRLNERRKILGREGLKKFSEELNEARSKKENSSKFDEIEIFSSDRFDRPEIAPIDLIFADEKLKLFQSSSSKFLRYFVRIPMENLDENLQFYLPLFTNLLFHSAIKSENFQISKRDFCQKFSRDVLNVKTRFGQSNSSPVQSSQIFVNGFDKLTISLESVNENETSRKTIDFLRQVLFSSDFSDLNIFIEEAEKLHKEIVETLQDGETIQQTFFNLLIVDDQPSHFFHRTNIFVQKKFLEKILEKNEENFLENLKKIQNFLRNRLSRIDLTICGDVEKFLTDSNFIKEFLVECQNEKSKNFEEKSFDEKKVSTRKIRTTIIGSAHEESSFVLFWTRRKINPDDFVFLLVLSNFLEMENGPLWTACRTNGFSYGVSFEFDFDQNLVFLSIDQCSQLQSAIQSAILTLKNLDKIDEKQFFVAKNFTISMLVERFATLGRATSLSIAAIFHSFSLEKYFSLIEQIDRLQFDEQRIKEIIEFYVKPVVDLENCSTLILVNSNKIKQTRDFLVKKLRLSEISVIKDVVNFLHQQKPSPQ